MHESLNYKQTVKNAFQRHYDENSDVWSNDIGMRVLPLLVQGKLNLNKENRILDIGCGSGADALIYSQFCKNVIGVDICHHSSWNEIQSNISNVMFKRTDYFEFYDEHPFDVIVDNGCMHHQLKEDLPAYLNKIRSSLTPGGCFVASTFCDYAKPSYIDDFNRIHHYFTNDEINEYINNALLKVIDTILIYRPKYNNYYRISFCVTQ